MWSWVETSSVWLCRVALECKLQQDGSHLEAILHSCVSPLLTYCGLPTDPRDIGSSHCSLLAKGNYPEEREALSYSQPMLAAAEKGIWAEQQQHLLCTCTRTYIHTYACTHMCKHMDKNTQGINSFMVRWLPLGISLRLRSIFKVGFSVVFAFLIIILYFLCN